MAVDSVQAMLSTRHEGLVEMFRQHPEFAARLLHDELGVDLPGYRQVGVESPDLSEPTPLERRADATVASADDAGKPVLAVVVEVQLQPSKEKRWSWPYYLVKVRTRLRCPVMLLVVCMDGATAKRCAAGIELGHPGWVLRPLVFGPDHVPVVTDPGQVVGMPELAVLSAMAHGGHPDYAKILNTLVAALADTDPNRAMQYSEIVLEVLPDAARRHLEDLMSTQTFEFQSAYARRLRAEGRAEGEAQGEARGEARLVLAVLDARGIDVPDYVRARITRCSDADQLEAWGRRAAVIRTIDDLFE